MPVRTVSCRQRPQGPQPGPAQAGLRRRGLAMRHTEGIAIGLAIGLALGLVPPARAADSAPSHPLLKQCEASQEPACLVALELSALRQYPSLARRDGHHLLLTQAGKAEPWSLDDRSEPPLSHHYLGPLAGTELQLVARREGAQAARFLMVGPGALGQALPAPPWPAPGGLLMLVAEPGRSQQPGSLSLLGKVSGQWRQLWRFDAVGSLGFGFRAWRSDAASARLDWACADGSAAGSVQLRDGPHGWDFVPAPPSCR